MFIQRNFKFFLIILFTESLGPINLAKDEPISLAKFNGNILKNANIKRVISPSIGYFTR